MSEHDRGLDDELELAYLAAEGDGDVLAALRERHERAWAVDAPVRTTEDADA